jgi:hypothetical protein
MRFNLAAMTALAGGLMLTATVSASAAPLPNLKPSIGTGSMVELAREGGRGGGGGGMRSGGGGGKGGGSGLAGRGGGGGGMRSGGGGGWSGGGKGGGPGLAGRGGRDGGGAMTRGGRYAGDGAPRIRGGDRGEWKGGRSEWKGGNQRRHAGRSHDGHKGQRHRVWRDGRWIWAWGPAVYAYADDCGWIWRRAQATGSPYWWRRYEECVGYY